MHHTDLIQAIRQKRNLSVEHCAAVIGLTVASFGDLEEVEDEEELWSLTIVEFLRLCLILHLDPQQLLPPDSNPRNGEPKHFAPDLYGKIHISKEIKRACPDLVAIEDTVGWYGAGLIEWLQDDWHLGQMPLAALKDLCHFLNWDIRDILQAYWQAIGAAFSDE